MGLECSILVGEAWQDNRGGWQLPYIVSLYMITGWLNYRGWVQRGREADNITLGLEVKQDKTSDYMASSPSVHGRCSLQGRFQVCLLIALGSAAVASHTKGLAYLGKQAHLAAVAASSFQPSQTWFLVRYDQL